MYERRIYSDSGERYLSILSIDELGNALDSLERANEFLHREELPTHLSKWTAICLHHALYGFLICAVRGTSNKTVVFKNKKGEEFLIGFNEALSRAQNEKYIRDKSVGPLNLSEEERESICILNEVFRNGFIHMIPGGWGFEESGWPLKIQHVLRAIAFLTLEGRHILWPNTADRDRAAQLLRDMKSKTEEMQAKFGGE